MIKKSKKIYIINKQENILIYAAKLVFLVEISLIFFLLICFYFTGIVSLICKCLLTFLIIICSYTLINIILLYYIKYSYYLNLNKIQLKYHKYIEKKRFNFNSKNYAKTIDIDSISELINLSKNSNNQIIYFEATPGEKCYFLLEDKENLYKYVLTKD